MMELERQVVSLARAQRLRALGVKQECICFWRQLAGSERWALHVSPLALGAPQTGYAAFTVAELGEMLPMDCSFTKIPKGWNAYLALHEGEFTEEAATEAEARGLLLAALIEAKAVTP